MDWYYQLNDVAQGPVSEETFRSLVANGTIRPETLVWHDGMTHWQSLAIAAPDCSTGATGADDRAQLKWILPVGRSGFAIVAGYLGLFSVLLLPAPLALLFGILGLVDIKRHPDKSGRGRAWFGIVMGSLFTLLLLVAILSSMIA